MDLNKKIENQSAGIAIIGLGYVGLPLAITFVDSGSTVIGLDIDIKKIDSLKNSKSYINHISNQSIQKMNDSNLFNVSSDFKYINEVDIIIICVPTPLTKNRAPDLSHIIGTAKSITKHLRKGQLVVLESSTYPGTTDEVLGNELEKSGLKKNIDFFLAYSPEREDPGNLDYETKHIPKIVGADSEIAKELAINVYKKCITNVVPVSSARAGEAIKLTENIFRSVNIALVNELKMIFDKMDIDVWEVLDAADSKPFGFMKFSPGPGVGGHCIPIDPFYLTYKAREYDTPTRFIELAGEINNKMPYYVVSKTSEALNKYLSKSINGSNILLVGMAYKKDNDDMRESPSLKIYEMLMDEGAILSFYDKNIQSIPCIRGYERFGGAKSIELSPSSLSEYDIVIIATNHTNCDYSMIVNNSKIIVDTRNALSGITGSAIIIKA